MKLVQALSFNLLLLITPTIGLSLDCDNAFTKLEQAICDDPLLVEVEQQLSALASAALDSGQIDSERARGLRDSLAQNCRRSSDMHNCLLADALQKIQWLMANARPAESPSDARPDTLQVVNVEAKSEKLRPINSGGETDRVNARIIVEADL